MKITEVKGQEQCQAEKLRSKLLQNGMSNYELPFVNPSHYSNENIPTTDRKKVCRNNLKVMESEKRKKK